MKIIKFFYWCQKNLKRAEKLIKNSTFKVSFHPKNFIQPIITKILACSKSNLARKSLSFLPKNARNGNVAVSLVSWSFNFLECKQQQISFQISTRSVSGISLSGSKEKKVLIFYLDLVSLWLFNAFNIMQSRFFTFYEAFFCAMKVCQVFFKSFSAWWIIVYIKSFLWLKFIQPNLFYNQSTKRFISLHHSQNAL